MTKKKQLRNSIILFFTFAFFYLAPVDAYGEITINNGKISFINESGNIDDLIKKTGNSLGITVFTNGDYSYVENINIKNLNFDDVINYLMKGTKYIVQKRDSNWNVFTKSSQEQYTEEIKYLHKTKYVSIATILDNVKKFNFDSKILEISKTGSLIVSGKVNDVIETVDFINTLDIPEDMFTVELLVVEYFHQNGFKWGIDITNGSYSNFGSGSFNPGSSDGNIDVTYNLGGALNQSFKLNLQALVEKSSAKIFQNPRLTTKNGESASIDIAEDKYVQLQSAGINGLTVDLRKLEAGIKLNITPTSISDSMINLSIEGNISEFVPFSGEGEYSIESRKIDTKVTMEDRQTLIIGGLIKEEEIKSRGGIPLLKDIPLLGALFSRKQNKTATIETVIYVTVYKKNPYQNNRNVLFNDDNLKDNINIKTN